MKNHQCLRRTRKVLQNEANKKMIKGFPDERQGKDVCLPELHVRESPFDDLSPGFCNRVCGEIYRREPSRRTSLSKGHCLGTDTAPDLEHCASAGIEGVGVQQVNQRPSLILKALVFARMIAVNIHFVHKLHFVLRLTPELSRGAAPAATSAGAMS